MKIRAKTLWRVPVYCTVASALSYYFTIYTARFFFVVKTVGADGVTKISTDPLRTALFHGVLFVVILLIGGLWVLRSMTKAEIAASAAILCVLYLTFNLAQLYVPNFPVEISMRLVWLQEWTVDLHSVLLRLLGNRNFPVFVTDFAPFLFVPFGKNQSSKSVK